MTNLDLWNKLGRTDPGHTKPFTRGGGFKGTAVKPIYTEHKMTEHFGPCGVGWGITEPSYQVVPGSDGQTAVYCWLSIWYVQDGKRSDPIPGVGGDMVIIKQQSGLRTSDEAFKAAFTDAVSNAMKHIGMSADVHMGRFEDNKYVREISEEIAEEKGAATPAKQAQPAVITPPELPAPSDPVADTLIAALKLANTVEDLNDWGASDATQVQIGDLPKSEAARVRAAWKVHKDRLLQQVAA